MVFFQNVFFSVLRKFLFKKFGDNFIYIKIYLKLCYIFVYIFYFFNVNTFEKKVMVYNFKHNNNFERLYFFKLTIPN